MILVGYAVALCIGLLVSYTRTQSCHILVGNMMDLAKVSFQYGSTISNAYHFLSYDSKVCLLCEQTFMSNDNAHLVKEVEDHVLKHHFLKSVFFL